MSQVVATIVYGYSGLLPEAVGGSVSVVKVASATASISAGPVYSRSQVDEAILSGFDTAIAQAQGKAEVYYNDEINNIYGDTESYIGGFSLAQWIVAMGNVISVTTAVV